MNRELLRLPINNLSMVLEQKQKMSDLTDELKEIKDQLRKKEECLYDTMKMSDLIAEMKEFKDELRKKEEFLYDTVKEISEVTNKSLDKTETLHQKFNIAGITNNGLKETEMLRQQCKALEKSLATEMKSHGRLLMEINKIEVSSVLNKQDESIGLIRSLLESTKKTSSKLTKLLLLAEECTGPNVNSNNLPAHILGIAFRIEKELGASADDKDKVKQFGLALGLNSSSVEKIVNEASGMGFWEVLYEWNKTSQSLAVLISACQRLSIYPFSDGLMPPDQSTAIEKAYSRLTEKVIVDPVVIYLRDNAVLTPIDVDYILSPKTRIEKFRRLVDILPLFGEKAFDCFVDALTKSDQNHLADILKDELKKLIPVSDTLNREELEQTLQSETTTDDEFHSLNESDEADFDLSSFILILLLQLSLFILYKIW